MRGQISILVFNMMIVWTLGNRTGSFLETSSESSDCNLQFANQMEKNEATVSVSVIDCTPESSILTLCQICEFHQSVAINMSRNNIKQLRNVECNCSGLLEIDMSNNDLTVLEANSLILFQSARRIILAGNNIYQLNERAFVGLDMLELLDLSRNSLQDIPFNAFDGALYLRILNLSWNKLRRIDKDMFQTLYNLEMIDLSYNSITYIKTSTFHDLINLKSIYLIGNKLSKPVLNFVLPTLNLSDLNLDQNLFSQFKAGSLIDFNIRKLSLSGLQQLRYILKGAFTNSEHLQEVDLSNNINLVFIEDGAFDMVPNLKYIDVSNTKLKVLPSFDNTVIYSQNISLVESNDQSCYNQNDSHFIAPDYLLLHDNVTSEDIRNTYCFPRILSDIKHVYTVYVGQRIQLECFAVGNTNLTVYWERAVTINGFKSSMTEIITSGYFLDLAIRSLSMSGQYRCVAEINNRTTFKYFSIMVKHTDIGLKVLTKNSHSILISWNRTHHLARYVVMHRAYETVTSYVKQRLNRYWKMFMINSLKPSTEYEICIATYTDDSDKTCIRTKTDHQKTETNGIHNNTLILTALSIAGIVIVVFVLSTIYRCADKIRVIRRHHVFIVGSESREGFADVSGDIGGDTNYTFENQHTDQLIETMQKTEL